MEFDIKTAGDYKYIEEGEGEILLLLHGLFGALSNWQTVIDEFRDNYKIIIPLMPIYEMPVRSASVPALVDFIEGFVDHQKLTKMSLMGNSLGGHIALVYALRHPGHVDRMILTGSSGLFENSMGGSFPKRGDYNYIKERVGYTFYNPDTIGQEYVDEIFETLKSIPKCMSIVQIAKSAQRHNLANDLHNIKAETLLIWGLNDTITPPMVAHDFNRLIPNSTLRFIDKCCHAPMMEQPGQFNVYLREFLSKT